MHRTIKKLLVFFSLFLFAFSVQATTIRPVVCPAVYTNVWGVTSYAGMAEAELTLNLTNTADLVAWQDKYAPNDPFTRTGAINVLDLEALLKKDIPTDVAAFYGGRAVTNYIFQSNTFTNAQWVAGTPVTTEDGEYKLNFTDVDEIYNLISSFPIPNLTSSNTTFAEKTITGLTDEYVRYSASGALYGYNLTWSIELKQGSLSQCKLYLWQYHAFADSYRLRIFGESTGYVYARNAQVEWGELPSESISTTTAAVTKFYKTENGNTVTDNVVTEATGADIESVIGMATWKDVTNVIGSAQESDFTHVDWNKVNGSITAGDVILVDGTTVSDKNTFTASAANATIILNPYVSASNTHAGGIFVKRKTGTDAIESTIDGGTTWVDKTSEIDSDAGWHLPQTSLTVTDPEIGLRLVGSGDAVYLDRAQLVVGDSVVPVHPVDGGSTMALADFHFNNNKLAKALKGSILVEIGALPGWSTFVNDTVILSNGDCEIRAEALASGISFNDGTNDTVGYAGTPSEKVKAVIVWEGTEVRITTINGTTTGIYAGNFGADTIYVGRNSTGNAFSGYISKISFYYGQALSDVEAELLIAIGCYVPIGNERVTDSEGEYIEDSSGECIYCPR